MTKLDQIRAAESRLLLQTYERNPILFVRGEGVHVFDEHGNKYLDLLSVEQIAAEWDETPKAIESLLTRARQAFRSAYEHLSGIDVAIKERKP